MAQFSITTKHHDHDGAPKFFIRAKTASATARLFDGRPVFRCWWALANSARRERVYDRTRSFFIFISQETPPRFLWKLGGVENTPGQGIFPWGHGHLLYKKAVGVFVSLI